MFCEIFNFLQFFYNIFLILYNFLSIYSRSLITKLIIHEINSIKTEFKIILKKSIKKIQKKKKNTKKVKSFLLNKIKKKKKFKLNP